MTPQTSQAHSVPPATYNSLEDGRFYEPTITSSETLFTLVSEKVDSIFKNHEPEIAPTSKIEVLSSARRDVQILLAELKYKAGKTEILLGTKREQATFLSRIENCLLNPGIFSQTELLRGMFETIIADELANGISRVKNFSSVLTPEEIQLNGKDARFNYPAIDRNSTLIPMDIHLAFEPKNTVQEALDRMQKQYRGRFNAIILINASRVPLGIIRAEELHTHSANTLLEDVHIDYSGPFGTLDTPSGDISEIMEYQGINIFPITDSKTDVLIGYITHETVTLQETRVYLPRLQAEIREQNLKDEIEAHVHTTGEHRA